MDDTYTTITGKSEGLYKEKGSKFIAFAYPVKDEDTIKEILQELKKAYHDARHHCYAYCLGSSKEQYRFNDDGEPSGTAGKPIYGQILSYDLTNILIVVIRYFGGTKLGVSGLINAYRTAAREAIEAAENISCTVNEKVHFQFDYERLNDVMRIVKDMNPDILAQDFNLSCQMTLSIRKSTYPILINRLESIDGLSITKNDTGL